MRKTILVLALLLCGAFSLAAQSRINASIYVAPVTGRGSRSDDNFFFYNQLLYELTDQKIVIANTQKDAEYSLIGTVAPYSGVVGQFAFHLALLNNMTGKITVEGELQYFIPYDTEKLFPVLVASLIYTIPGSLGVTGVTLNKSSLSLTVGNTETLVATVSPGNATNKNVEWKSSDTGVAIVINGTVTAVSAGSATIIVTTEDGGKTDFCSVTVTNRPVPVTGVALNKSSLSLTVGNTETLVATVSPGNATNKNVEWKSSDIGVAIVINGTVTAVSAGSATIIVTTEDGGKTAFCSVAVANRPVPVTKVTLNQTSLSLGVGKSATLFATVSPGDATNKNVEWKSSDTGVAIVINGTVTAVSAGQAIIIVTTQDGGKTDFCSVTVTGPGDTVSITEVTLSKTSLSLTVGNTETLVATVSPGDATNKNVEWKSSDTGVAKVINGTVTAVSAGQAIIIVTTQDGGKTAICSVTVTVIGPNDPSLEVTLNKSSLSMTVGNTETLVATVSPGDATNKNVEWKSSDTGVAKVINGTVTAVSAGQAAITVTTQDGGKTATCSVTVSGEESPLLYLGLGAKWTPGLYVDNNMSWAPIPSMQGGILAEFHFLSFMSLETGAEVQWDGVKVKDLPKPAYSIIIGIPLLVKFCFKPGANSMIEPYIGPYFNFKFTGNIEPALISARAGLQYSFKVGPGALFLDGGFTGDLIPIFNSKAGTTAYRRYNFHVGLGYKFGLFQRVIK